MSNLQHEMRALALMYHVKDRRAAGESDEAILALLRTMDDGPTAMRLGEAWLQSLVRL